MKRLSKGLQEFGGKTRIITTEEFNINNINKIGNLKIKEFLAKVPKKELLDGLENTQEVIPRIKHNISV